MFLPDVNVLCYRAQREGLLLRHGLRPLSRTDLAQSHDEVAKSSRATENPMRLRSSGMG